MIYKIVRKFFSLGAVQWIMAGIVSGLIWAVYSSCRVSITNKKTLWSFKKKPVIFAFWHGRSMMLSPLVRKGRFDGYAIASTHRDGRLMAKIQRIFGLKTIWGTSKRNGISVLRQGLKVLKRGSMICMTPDGPKGPRMRLRDGIFYFAKITGAPILPVCYSSSRPKILRNWDKYMIPKPFSRVKIEVGVPVYIPRNISDSELSEVKKKLEQTMVKQLQDMDASFGLPLIEPK
ncbi:MAG: lysophospholipid acyltransferase family protein [Rickettsiales bacterium]|jgi:lysophospholipid acyltransferase (LPLAT)-like uncharacterized protein|nr:lysophospholipid acyltransferase family protein [Rickettsiales bacterium]